MSQRSKRATPNMPLQPRLALARRRRTPPRRARASGLNAGPFRRCPPLSMPEPILTHDDLVIESDASSDYSAWLAPWRGLISQPRTPLLLNRFGCWFFQRPDGSVEMLDVFFGSTEAVDTHAGSVSVLHGDPSSAVLSPFTVSARPKTNNAGLIASSVVSCYAICRSHPLAGGPDPWLVPQLNLSHHGHGRRRVAKHL